MQYVLSEMDHGIRVLNTLCIVCMELSGILLLTHSLVNVYYVNLPSLDFKNANI